MSTLTHMQRATLNGLHRGEAPSSIARDLGVSRQRLGQLCNALIDRGLVERYEVPGSRPGRKAARWRVTAEGCDALAGADE